DRARPNGRALNAPAQESAPRGTRPDPGVAGQGRCRPPRAFAHNPRVSAQTSKLGRFGRIESRDLTQAAVFAGLLAALGLPGTLSLGPTGVPITLQTLGVMLAGSILGPRKGALAVALFTILAVAGLPILAGGRTGLVALSSPTAG